MRWGRRRKQRQTEPESQPEAVDSTDSTEPSVEEAAAPLIAYSQEPPAEPSSYTASTPEVVDSEPTAAEARRPVLRQPVPFIVNWPVMLIIVVLIGLTVFALLWNQNVLPVEVLTWWPLAIAVPSALWLLIALFRRDGRGMLGAAALFGASISLLLTSDKLALLPTLVGITFIAAGTGIMLRGLLLGRQPIG
jgi:hypothetical protein